MAPNFTRMLESLTGILLRAAAIMRRDGHEVFSKGSVENIVTSADTAVQAFLEKELAELLPGSAFFGEEGLGDMSNREYLWIVDPIDGTTNFARGAGESAISVGLVHHDRAVIGAVYNPFRNEMFTAEAGKGAWLNGNPIHTSAASFAEGIFCTAWSLYNKNFAPQCKAIMEEVYEQCNDFRRFGSCALELCYLAAGRYDLYFEIRVFPWDYAAACLILQEAGGFVSGFDGKTLPYDRATPIIGANNPENFRQLLRIVQKHIPQVPYEEILI